MSDLYGGFVAVVLQVGQGDGAPPGAGVLAVDFR
jgi:hypothetical protein